MFQRFTAVHSNVKAVAVVDDSTVSVPMLQLRELLLDDAAVDDEL